MPAPGTNGTNGLSHVPVALISPSTVNSPTEVSIVKPPRAGRTART
ncbi:Uncharacterised protein [Mycobacteroides abscessus subsp. abscessus]|nr:Uncharacterised protein [Mycobacteroides abscessus subsp. abscessus]